MAVGRSVLGTGLVTLRQAVATTVRGWKKEVRSQV